MTASRGMICRCAIFNHPTSIAPCAAKKKSNSRLSIARLFHFEHAKRRNLVLSDSKKTSCLFQSRPGKSQLMSGRASTGDNWENLVVILNEFTALAGVQKVAKTKLWLMVCDNSPSVSKIQFRSPLVA